jgi:hypothetical protein
MEDRRKYKRFPIQLSAHYLGEDKEEWKECSVTNVSREGMGIEMHVRERIDIGSILQLEIIVPIREEPISIIGILRWIKELEGNPKFNFIGGVELSRIDPEDKWALLDYVYEDWCRKDGI